MAHLAHLGPWVQQLQRCLIVRWLQWDRLVRKGRTGRKDLLRRWDQSYLSLPLGPLLQRGRWAQTVLWDLPHLLLQPSRSIHLVLWPQPDHSVHLNRWHH